MMSKPPVFLKEFYSWEAVISWRAGVATCVTLKPDVLQAEEIFKFRFPGHKVRVFGGPYKNYSFFHGEEDFLQFLDTEGE